MSGVSQDSRTTITGHLLRDDLNNLVKSLPSEITHQIPKTEQEIKEAKERLKNFPTYSCPICHDGKYLHPVVDGITDYTRITPCKCVREELERKKRDNLIKYCEVPAKGREMTFENFKISKLLKEAFDDALAISKGDFPFTFLTLVGDSTHGKTHLAVSCVNYRLAHGNPAKYVHVPILLEELRNAFRGEGDESYQNRFETFLNVPLLVLDDLGTENPTPWANEKLDTIIDYRLMHKLFTVVTTNLPLFSVRGGPALPFRIANRLTREGKVDILSGSKFIRSIS
jgi:DNA replication protein DnaC